MLTYFLPQFSFSLTLPPSRPNTRPCSMLGQSPRLAP
jgi:hypothetical protein